MRVASEAPYPRARAGIALAGIALAGIVLDAGPANAGGVCCPDVTTQTGVPNEVVQEFEHGGAVETRWRVRYAHRRGRGLYITGAWFTNDRGDEYQVIGELAVSEIFVVYNAGDRRYPIHQLQFPMLPATLANSNCCGEVLDGIVVGEVQPRGLIWKNDEEVERGNQLVLRAAMDAANFNYIYQYVFRDDGIIDFRVGVTGRPLPGSEEEVAIHSVLWRIDLDIDGADHDRARLVRHLASTTAESATDEADTIANERSADWVAEEFTTLRVEDTVTENRNNHSVAYDLMLERWGSARHFEPFTHADLWITRYRAGEGDYSRLPHYDDGESIDDTDLVVWLATPVQHIPRHEDGVFYRGRFYGAIHTLWTGAILKPRNVFDRTPFK